MVTIKIGTQTGIYQNYRHAYNDMIFELAHYHMKRAYDVKFVMNEIDNFTKAAVKCLICAEREEIKRMVDSDYDYFIDEDEGGLFDLLQYLYHRKDDSSISDKQILQQLGERLVRNYELNALKQIDIDVNAKMVELYDEREKAA